MAKEIMKEAAEKKESEVITQKDGKWVLGRVATQTAEVIVNSQNEEEQLTVEMALVKLLNYSEEIMRRFG